MQYNYTTNVPGKFDQEIGFNYRNGSVFYIESSQSQLQIQYELALDALNTDLSLGFEHKLAKFDSLRKNILEEMKIKTTTGYTEHISLPKQN